MKKVEAVVSVAVQHVTETAGEHKGDAWKTPTDVLPEPYAVETGHDHVAEYNIGALRFLSTNCSASAALEASTV